MVPSNFTVKIEVAMNGHGNGAGPGILLTATQNLINPYNFEKT